MRLVIFLFFLGLSFSIFSCSHNSYEDFQQVHVGNDKQQLFDEIGSPLRTRFQDGKNIWTYRFYVNDIMIYKDITLENDKVTAIGDSKEVDMKAAEEKEKKIEAAILKDKENSSKPQVDTPKKSAPDDFKPIESED